MKELIILITLMMMPLVTSAQNEVNKKQTKYEEFISKTGSIVKYVEKKIENVQVSASTLLKGKLRVAYGENKNTYFVIIKKEKTLTSESSNAYIEYSDLVEINKALQRLLNEVDDDGKLKPEYLQNSFISEDFFEIGYYIEKTKVNWFIKLEFRGEIITLKRPVEFAQYLRDVQKEIENLMNQYGK